MRLHRREEGYALIVTMLVVLVVGGLVTTVLTTTERGLAQSKRSGDSANALQVADAGVNAGVKAITNFAGPTTGPGPHLVLDETLPGGGDRYRVEATRHSACDWTVVSTGFDETGVKRTVRADSRCQSKFANAVFAQSVVNFGSGVAVDSYKGGMSQAETCNFRGSVGTNSPESNDIDVSGIGHGVRNCTSKIPGFVPAGGYVYDECIGYGDPPEKFLNEEANAASNTCGKISYVRPEFPFDNVTLPATVTRNLRDFVCNGPQNLAPGKYIASSIVLEGGCVIPDSTVTQDNAVEIYTAGAVTIGKKSKDVVNAPPSNCPGTSPTGSDYYGGTASSPLWYYCTGWPGKTQIYVAGSGKVNFTQHVRFFGVVWAPQRTLGGGPQPLVWGAVAGSSIESGAQFSIHYDEALGLLSNGRYSIRSWREKR